MGAYTPNSPAWAADDSTPLSPTRLNHIEEGIADLGRWSSFTPTWTNLTVGNGSNTGNWTQVGETAFCRIALTFGSTTSISGAPSVVLPGTSPTSQFAQDVYYFDASTSTVYLGWGLLTGGSLLLRSRTVSSSLVTVASLSSSSPFLWTTSDQIVAAVSYRVTA